MKELVIEDLMEELQKALIINMLEENPVRFRKAVAEMIKNEKEDCNTCEDKEKCLLHAIHIGKIRTRAEIESN